MTTAASAQERAALADAVRRCLEKHTGPRHWMAGDDGPARSDRDLWRVLTQQVGLTSLVVPEGDGGAGGQYADLALAFEALGARLSPVPALSTAGMATAVLLSAEPCQAVRSLLNRIAAGDVASVVWPEVHGPAAALAKPKVEAYREGQGYVLTGTASCVLDGAEADLLIVPALLDRSVVLFSVEGSAPGLLRRSMTTLDLTRSMAEIALDDVPAELLGAGEAADAALGVGFDLSLVVLAAEQVGLAQACLEAAVAYVKDRVQFDRPIGSFQAVKHKLVDLLLRVELARSAKDEAVAAADRHLAEHTPASEKSLRAAASMAKAMCGETATFVTRETLHVFGGIGFTWEHDSHLYYRRAMSDELLLGDPPQHRVRLAAAVGV